MKQRSILWQAAGFAVVTVGGTILHFLYDWTGGSILVSPFSGVNESTFCRKMAPLKAISDNYPKTVITLDRYTLGNYEGIRVVNAIDWLLDK